MQIAIQSGEYTNRGDDFVFKIAGIEFTVGMNNILTCPTDPGGTIVVTQRVEVLPDDTLYIDV